MLLLLPATLPGEGADGGSLTSGTLTIRATRTDGKAVDGVTFVVNDARDQIHRATTDSGGRATVLYSAPRGLGLPPISLEGDAFRIVQSNSSNMRGAQGVVAEAEFTVLPTNPEHMSRGELIIYSQMFREILADARDEWSARKGPPDKPGRLRLAYFLDGLREEAISVFRQDRPSTPTATANGNGEGDGEEEEEAPPDGIVVRVVDSHGNLVTNRLVVLFGQDEESGEVQVVHSARTGRDGLALLRIDEPGRFHRVEVPPAGDGRLSRGPVFLGKEELIGQDRPSVLVLRPPRETISGLVYNGDRPATGVQIETADPDRPVISTAVDEFGFFELGPVQGETVTLAIRRSANSEPTFFRARPGREEAFIPLDILLMTLDR